MDFLNQRFVQLLSAMRTWFQHLLHARSSPAQHLTSHSHASSVLLLVIFILIAAVGSFAIIQYRAKIVLHERMALVRNLQRSLSAKTGMEDNLRAILARANEIVKAPYFAFYLWDEMSVRYMLRSVSHPYDAFEGVAPSYTGLALPKKDVYLPPSVLDIPEGEQVVSRVYEGDVPLVLVRIGKRRGLLRIGPVQHLARKQRVLLGEMADFLIGPLNDYLNLEMAEINLKVKYLSDSAINKIASIASNPMSSIDLLLKVFKGIVGGLGGLYAEVTADGTVKLHAPDELLDMTRALERDQESIRYLVELSAGSEEKIIQRQDPEFYELPIALTSRDDIQAIIVISFHGEGTLVMLQDMEFKIEAWRNIGRTQVRFLTNQVTRLSQSVAVQKAFAKGYTRILCEIADFIDNLNPFTVGYSDMMTHYALSVGREMNLTDVEMHDLALAARLSNIGVVGMDTSLLVKKGRYSEAEYNLMRRHPEIGSSMMELVTGNRRAAEYVLYHHERVDGHGYPSGLHAAQIPLPAKIMHVVQVFLAKVNGRSWRTPLSFEYAIDELHASVGSSLDGDVVRAFVAWWDKSAVRRGRQEVSLGHCYEMCCVPKHICETCPAMLQPSRCWDMEDNQCRLHGRECNTCFVKTEYEYRTKNRGVSADGGLVNV